MPAPTVSVVIPTNRGGDFLAEAVASVRRQTLAVHEIILVDDGSPGAGLASVAAELGISYRRQEPSGVSVARNRGVAACSGEWVGFLDDDDIWHPERIAAMMQAAGTRADVVACYTGGWWMDASGTPFGEWPGTPGTTEQFLRGEVNTPILGTMLIRRDTYQSVGGFLPSFRQAEDDELILRLLQAGAFVGVDRPLFGYRRHGSNMTDRDMQRKHTASERAITLQMWGAEARGDTVALEWLRENLRRYHRRAADDTVGRLLGSLKRGNWSTAIEAGAWAVRNTPLQLPASLGRWVTSRLPRAGR